MYAATAVTNFKNLQKIFSLVAVLQLTSHLYKEPANVKDGATYDFIIVGGGTAGCVIASALADCNAKVLLIEAGGNPPLESLYPAYFAYSKHTINDWNVISTREEILQYHKGSVSDITQGKMLGGSSSLNYMVYVRGNPSDYDKWAAITNDCSWSFESVLPFFIKSEGVIDEKILNSPEDRGLHGINGKLKLRKYYDNISDPYFSAFEELGIKPVVEINVRNPLGVTNVLFTADKKQRSSTANAFLGAVKNKQNLDILLNALVTKILFDSEKNAVGVQICTKDKKNITVKANKEVIITAGVFKTPQLLMVSGIGPKKHLKSKNIEVIYDLPVGKNLQDHPICALPFKMGDPRPPTGTNNPHLIEIPAIDGHIALNKSQKYPDYEVLSLIFDDPETFLVICAISFSFTNEICDNIIKYAAGKQIYFVFNQLPSPKSRGQILLNTTNMEDQPIINIGYYSNDRDVEIHVKNVMHFNAILNTTYFRSVNAELIDPKLKACAGFENGSKEYWRCYVLSMATTSHDYVGTCAMGRVVDSKLLVKGVKRLRIADASIMPTIVSSPTQAAVIMIAQKASDMIMQEHSLK